MRKTKIPVIFLIIQLLASVLLTWSMISSEMLPLFYIVAAIVIELVLLMLAIILDFSNIKGRKKFVVITRRIIALILAVFMLGLSIFSSLLIDQIKDTIVDITSKKTMTSVVAVYVHANDKAESLKDAKYYTFGYSTAFDGEKINTAVKDIKKEVGQKADFNSYDDIMDMVNAFYDDEIDAIVLSESYAAIIADQEDYKDFTANIKKIYKHQIISKVQHRENKKVSDDSGCFIFYLSGSDTRSQQIDVSRSDVNILMAVNTKTKEIVLINTPRDYYVPISISSSGTRDKLTHCGIYGIECSMDTLSNLYGYDIDYYAQINFTGFAQLIDAIGGVTVNSDVAFTNSRDNKLLDGTSLTVNVGENYFNGAQALAFARERQTVAGGDNDRGKNQMRVITAVVDKMSSAKTVLSNYSDILKSLGGMFVTNMSPDDINSLVKMQLSDMASWHVHSYAVSGAPGSAVTYSMPGASLYVTYPNQDTVDHASKLIEKVLAGKEIKDSDVA